MFGMMLNSFSIYLPKMLLFIYHIHAKQIFCQNLIYFSFDLSAARRTRRLWHTNMHTLTQPKYTDEQIYANSFNSRSIDLYFIFSNILGSKKLYWNEHDLNFLFLKKETVNVKEVMNNKPPAERYNWKPSTLNGT